MSVELASSLMRNIEDNFNTVMLTRTLSDAVTSI